MHTKGDYLTNSGLEDLLAFDDIFLDYFNNFLKNPVNKKRFCIVLEHLKFKYHAIAFPQPIQYNRYQSIFEELDNVPGSIINLDRLPKHLTHKLASTLHLNQQQPNQNGATPANQRAQDNESPNLNDLENQKVFDWVRQERLPLFFRTDFFREFKLCRLLTRSLEEEDDTHSADSSQMIGGYSRQSPSISNTLSTEEQEGRMSMVAGLFYNSGSKRINDSQGNKTQNTDTESLFKNHNIDLSLLERFNRVLFQRPGSRALSVPSYFPFQSVNFSTNQTNVFLKGRTNEESSIPRSGKTNKTESRTKQQNKVSRQLLSIANTDSVEKKKNDQLDDFNSSGEDEYISDSEVTVKFDSLKDSAHNTNKNSNNTDGAEKPRTIAFSQTKEIKGVNNEMFYSEMTKSYDEGDFESASRVNKKLEDVEDEQEDEVDEEDVLELKQHNTTTIQTNQSLKLDDNISFIDDNENFYENEELHASINQYKLKYLGSVRGMSEFREFLKDSPTGAVLIKFWLDCEFYRDSMQDYDQIENMATRNRLFRDINEKYVFSFSKKMHQSVSKNYLESSNLNHTIFDNIQYDILRRIRAYWVPRFILSKLKVNGKDYGYSFMLPPITPMYSRQSTYVSAKSAEQYKKPLKAIGPKKSYEGHSNKSLMIEKVKEALYADKAAGGPFLRYISGNQPDNLPLILFWYDVCDFYEIDVTGFDKNSRIQHAWAIYNSYLSPTARFNIGLPRESAEEARAALQQIANSSNFNSISVIDKRLFQPIMEQIIPHLESSWVKFIKDDVFKYTKSRFSALMNRELGREEGGENDSEDELQDLFDKIPEPDLEIEDSNIYLKRPWIKNFMEMSAKNKIVKRELTEEEKQERQERIRLMEVERKKALKRAKKRIQLQKLKSESLDRKMSVKTHNTTGSEFMRRLKRGKSAAKEEEEEKEKIKEKKMNSLQNDKGSYFSRMLASNKHMIQLYRKFFMDTNRRDFLNKFNSFIEAKQYNDSIDPVKKAKLALSLLQVYLSATSKKKILPLSEKLQKKFEADMKTTNRGQPRPRTPFFKELVKEFRPMFEDEFVRFCEAKQKEHELESPEDFANLTQTELLILLGDTYNAKNFDFDDEKGEGKQSATKEDKAELVKYLYEWSIGNYPELFWNYFIHLGDYGQKDGLPFLDKDLLFCIDAVRMREINGEAVLKQKALMIHENYLDSAIHPTVQLDCSNEIAAKLTKAYGRIVNGNHTPSDLTGFDEARVQLVKELLPYWAGYKHYAKNAENEPPLSKQQKKLKERLEEFLSVKNSCPDDFKLPVLSPRESSKNRDRSQILSSSQNRLEKPSRLSNIVFSIATGIRYKDEKTLQREESMAFSEMSKHIGGKSSTLL